ncbi:hypothetical protein PInf_013737 [Phytophthora infestans]|nr:hypothetical protein PInf_013737 [Phytophthora infestans]
MSPTDVRALAQALSDQVRTLTAELQTAQNARDQAQRAEAAAQQAYQSLSTSSYATQDPRRLLADQTVEIRDLAGRLDRASSTAAADESLDRLRDELRLTQEEVVTNDYVGSAHGGSALGSARGGSPVPNPPPSSPNLALALLSDELEDTKESLEKASAGRDYALEEFVRGTQARDEIQDKLADTELQRDKAATEWADAKRTQTELESKLRRMSDKFKDAEATSTKLRDQLATARAQHQQLVLQRDRRLSERDLARRRLIFGGRCYLRSPFSSP